MSEKAKIDPYRELLAIAISPPPGVIQKAVLVEIMPTKVWIESGMLGERVVVVQHQGCEPFDYATFGYDYRYTSNSSTWNAAHSLALQLGAKEPVERHQRRFPPNPTKQDLVNSIAVMQKMLGELEGGAA